VKNVIAVTPGASQLDFDFWLTANATRTRPTRAGRCPPAEANPGVGRSRAVAPEARDDHPAQMALALLLRLLRLADRCGADDRAALEPLCCCSIRTALANQRRQANAA
jgi:hypothetical protein